MSLNHALLGIVCASLAGACAPDPEDGVLVDVLDGPPLLDHDPDAHFESLVITVDGVSESIGNGHIGAEQALPETPGDCAPSTRLEFYTLRHTNDAAHNQTYGEIYFPGELVDGATTHVEQVPLSVAPLLLDAWDSLENAVLSGGTATYSSPQDGVYVVEIVDTSLCNNPQDYYPGVEVQACSPAALVRLEFTGVIGAGEPRTGHPGWNVDDENLCILPLLYGDDGYDT